MKKVLTTLLSMTAAASLLLAPAAGLPVFAKKKAAAKAKTTAVVPATEVSGALGTSVEAFLGTAEGQKAFQSVVFYDSNTLINESTTDSAGIFYNSDPATGHIVYSIEIEDPSFSILGIAPHTSVAAAVQKLTALGFQHVSMLPDFADWYVAYGLKKDPSIQSGVSGDICYYATRRPDAKQYSNDTDTLNEYAGALEGYTSMPGYNYSFRNGDNIVSLFVSGKKKFIDENDKVTYTIPSSTIYAVKVVNEPLYNAALEAAYADQD